LPAHRRIAHSRSGEGSPDVEIGAVAQPVVTGSRELVRHRFDGDHAIGSGALALGILALGDSATTGVWSCEKLRSRKSWQNYGLPSRAQGN
jgi:hypothetical protein